jgi:hypothetical protein
MDRSQQQGSVYIIIVVPMWLVLRPLLVLALPVVMLVPDVSRHLAEIYIYHPRDQLTNNNKGREKAQPLRHAR